MATETPAAAAREPKPPAGDAAFFSAVDELYASRGALAVVELWHAGDGRVAVWTASRGLSLDDMIRSVRTSAGYGDALRFVNYAYSGAARGTLAGFLGHGDRRVLRIVSSGWRKFLDVRAWKVEEQETETRLLRLRDVYQGAHAAGEDVEGWRGWRDTRGALREAAREASWQQFVAAAEDYAGSRWPLMRALGLGDLWYSIRKWRQLEALTEGRRAEQTRLAHASLISIGDFAGFDAPPDVAAAPGAIAVNRLGLATLPRHPSCFPYPSSFAALGAPTSVDGGY
jgi:hypothetical protein